MYNGCCVELHINLMAFNIHSVYLQTFFTTTTETKNGFQKNKVYILCASLKFYCPKELEPQECLGPVILLL